MWHTLMGCEHLMCEGATLDMPSGVASALTRDGGRPGTGPTTWIVITRNTPSLRLWSYQVVLSRWRRLTRRYLGEGKVHNSSPWGPPSTGAQTPTYRGAEAFHCSFSGSCAHRASSGISTRELPPIRVHRPRSSDGISKFTGGTLNCKHELLSSYI